MPVGTPSHEEYSGPVLVQSGISLGFVRAEEYIIWEALSQKKEYKHILLQKFYKNTLSMQTHEGPHVSERL